MIDVDPGRIVTVAARVVIIVAVDFFIWPEDTVNTVVRDSKVEYGTTVVSVVVRYWFSRLVRASCKTASWSLAKAASKHRIAVVRRCRYRGATILSYSNSNESM